MSTRLAVAAALAAALGALHPSSEGLGLAAVVGLLAAGTRRRSLVPIAVALLVSGLAHRSLDGLEGVREQVVAGEVELVGDPTPAFGGVRVDVRHEGRRLEAIADGAAAAALEPRLAGEVVTIRGTVSPLGQARPWLTSRHVSGRLRILAVERWRPGDPASRLANGLRRTLVEGAAPLPERQRSLFTGLVLGDDRHQPADLADAFRGAGLTHLLAVSGQNVAFTLALAGPVLRRLRLWPRLLATLGLIGLFGVVTRFEPSVLRASAMAALAATVAMAGRPTSRLRIIATAVALLLVVDPLLVRSVGFQLSVLAAASIVVLAPRLAPLLPGPAGLRDALAVTVAAQLGVAPVLLLTFGPIPVASLPANLLAVPVAGLVMVWGLTAGLVAGPAGAGLAALVHRPTGLALGWIEAVATAGARASLGELGRPHVLAVASGLALVALARERTGPRRAGWALVLATVAAALLSAHAPVPLRSAPLPGVVRWHHQGTDVIVLGGGRRTGLGVEPALEALRRAGVGRIDLLVVADATVSAEVVGELVAIHPAADVVTHPAVDGGPGSVPVARPGGTAAVGALTVTIAVVGDRLVVEAVARPP